MPTKLFKKGHVPWNKGKKYHTGLSWNRGKRYSLPHIKGKRHNPALRVKHSSGYILYQVGKEHPFSDIRGYIPEQRYVIEQQIGRYIDTGKETVHHINKNKKDNSLSNLMLVLVSEHIRYENGWFKKDGRWFKTCTECKVIKEVCVENFYKRKIGNEKYFYACIECTRVMNREKSWKNNRK
jgi:hypothetical protein